MSGHSKWHSIRHKKGIVDARRGKLFAKLIRQIEVAARQGGGDPKGNPTLQTAIQKAKEASMPWENIERAIKRGTGELQGTAYERISYEAYAPAGVALLIEVLTDNRNRAAADVRSIVTRNGGSMGEPGSVSWIFEKRGVVTVEAGSVDEETLLEIAAEVGAEDLDTTGSLWEVRTTPERLREARDKLEKAGAAVVQAEVTMVPQTVVPISERATAQKVLKVIDALEDCDDVQAVYANFDIPEEILAEAG